MNRTTLFRKTGKIKELRQKMRYLATPACSCDVATAKSKVNVSTFAQRNNEKLLNVSESYE